MPTSIRQPILVTNTMYLCVPGNSSYSFKFQVHLVSKGKQSFALPCTKYLFLGEFLLLALLNTKCLQFRYKSSQVNCSACL